MIKRLKQEGGDTAACTVCYEDYAVGDRVSKLPCSHMFCIACVRQWLRRNGTCPVCRMELDDDTESDVRNDVDRFSWPTMLSLPNDMLTESQVLIRPENKMILFYTDIHTNFVYVFKY